MALSPKSAMGLSFLVPGAAHFLLGRKARAAVAFATTVGTFLAGWLLLHDRIWFFELFKPFALIKPLADLVPINLLPEVGNTGCSILAALLREAGSNNADRLMRNPVPLDHLAGMLTGASGMLGFLWASDAFAIARGATRGPVQPGTAALLSWVLPGSGHWLVGQKDKGVLMGGAVVIVWVMGLAFSLGQAVDRPLQSAWWIGQSFFGGGVAVAAVTTGPSRLAAIPPFLDLGVCLCTVAGLMNVVVMVDAYTRAETKGLATSPAPGGALA